MDTLLQQETFECYQYYKQPSSLSRSLLKWILIHLLLLIFYLPLSLILFVSLLFSVCCSKEASLREAPPAGDQYRSLNMDRKPNDSNNNSNASSYFGQCQRLKLLVHPGVIYLFTASLLVILYLIDVFHDVLRHLHIEEFYTLTPYVLFILFKDAVVYSLNMRKALLTALFIFRDTPCCKYHLRLFSWILTNYWIWGVKMNPESRRQSQLSAMSHRSGKSERSLISKYIPLDFKQVPVFRNLTKLHRMYGKEEYALFCISFVAGLGFVFSSFVFYILKYHQSSGDVVVLWMLFVIGVIFKIFTVVCVARFVELIFYGFQVYYNHMVDLCEEIEFQRHYADSNIRQHYNEIKSKLKTYDAIKRKPKFEISPNMIAVVPSQSPSFSQRTSMYVQSVMDSFHKERDLEAKHEDDAAPLQRQTIDLSLNDEWTVWFENWCRIETLSSLYFHNRQNIVFGVIACTLIAVTVLFYQIFICDTLVDELNLSCFCGLGYVVIVVFRFIIWSFKFSKLEIKQIRLLRKQKMYINHKRILLLKKLKKDQNEAVLYEQEVEVLRDQRDEFQIQEYEAICDQLDGVMQHIGDRSLCPKIAGVTLNRAFVNLTITSIFGYVFAWILYRLRRDYVHEH